jgi:hypothetical protein
VYRTGAPSAEVSVVDVFKETWAIVGEHTGAVPMNVAQDHNCISERYIHRVAGLAFVILAGASNG